MAELKVNESFKKYIEKKSFQGKAESAVWKKYVTERCDLKAVLDVMDGINAADISPKQKSALMQRILDFAQVLSSQIYRGEVKVPDSIDNETIKEFNLRTQHSAYQKYHWKRHYGEPAHGDGYWDENNKFVEFRHYTSRRTDSKAPEDVVIRGGGSNPRWHPIPLKPTTITPTPVNPHDKIIPVVPPSPGTNEGNTTTGETGVGGTGTSGTEKEKGADEKKKRRRIGAFLIPLIAAGILAKECQPQETIIKDAQTDNIENVITATPQFNETESAYLKYTAQKGKAMLNKQGVENADVVYDNFVNNIDKMPKELQDLVSKYNMGTATDGKDINIFDNPQVTATTLILMAESYPNIAPIIHNQIQNPGAEISPVQISSINSRCKLAEHAHKINDGAVNANRISTIDYGLYGAKDQTGPSVKFSSQKEILDYNDVVKDVFQNNQSSRY